MFFSRPVLLLVALGSGATQFVTYGLGNFTTLFLMREKGMTLSEVALWYALLVGIGMSAGMYRLGPADRPLRAAIARRPTRCCRRSRWRWPIPFFSASSGRRPGRSRWLFLPAPTFLNYFYLSSAVTLVQEEVRPDQRVLSGALLLLVMNFIGLGLGPDLRRRGQRLLPRRAIPTIRCRSRFYTLVPFYVLAIVLFLWLAGRCGAKPRRPETPHEPRSVVSPRAGASLPLCIAGARQRRQDPRRSRAPAGAVRGDTERRHARLQGHSLCRAAGRRAALAAAGADAALERRARRRRSSAPACVQPQSRRWQHLCRRAARR